MEASASPVSARAGSVRGQGVTSGNVGTLPSPGRARRAPPWCDCWLWSGALKAGGRLWGPSSKRELTSPHSLCAGFKPPPVNPQGWERGWLQAGCWRRLPWGITERRMKDGHLPAASSTFLTKICDSEQPRRAHPAPGSPPPAPQAGCTPGRHLCCSGDPPQGTHPLLPKPYNWSPAGAGTCPKPPPAASSPLPAPVPSGPY